MKIKNIIILPNEKIIALSTNKIILLKINNDLSYERIHR
jgi:hypothetical protein